MNFEEYEDEDEDDFENCEELAIYDQIDFEIPIQQCYLNYEVIDIYLDNLKKYSIIDENGIEKIMTNLLAVTFDNLMANGLSIYSAEFAGDQYKKSGQNFIPCHAMYDLFETLTNEYCAIDFKNLSVKLKNYTISVFTLDFDL